MMVQNVYITQQVQLFINVPVAILGMEYLVFWEVVNRTVHQVHTGMETNVTA